MAKAEARRTRPRDATTAQEAILDAAEAAFAEQGFAGARIDAIAEAASYNKSLIFHYFDDKLGLYSAVLKRADRQGSALQAEIFGSLLGEATITAESFRAFVERAVRTTFDYYVSHRRLLRIFAWEEAEGWTTFGKIASQFDQSDVEAFAVILERAQRAGVLRPGVSPYLILYIIFNSFRTYLTSLPLLQIVTGDDRLTRSDALARAREEIVAFAVHGMIADPGVGAGERQSTQTG
jgi:AcrR family transcriptional regulator